MTLGITEASTGLSWGKKLRFRKEKREFGDPPRMLRNRQVWMNEIISALKGTMKGEGEVWESEQQRGVIVSTPLQIIILPSVQILGPFIFICSAYYSDADSTCLLSKIPSMKLWITHSIGADQKRCLHLNRFFWCNHSSSQSERNNTMIELYRIIKVVPVWCFTEALPSSPLPSCSTMTAICPSSVKLACFDMVPTRWWLSSKGLLEGRRWGGEAIA